MHALDIDNSTTFRQIGNAYTLGRERWHAPQNDLGHYVGHRHLADRRHRLAPRERPFDVHARTAPRRPWIPHGSRGACSAERSCACARPLHLSDRPMRRLCSPRAVQSGAHLGRPPGGDHHHHHATGQLLHHLEEWAKSARGSCGWTGAARCWRHHRSLREQLQSSRVCVDLFCHGV